MKKIENKEINIKKAKEKLLQNADCIEVLDKSKSKDLKDSVKRLIDGNKVKAIERLRKKREKSAGIRER